MKNCNTCGKSKEEYEFHKRSASKDGLSAKCKVCAKEYDDKRANLEHRVKARSDYAKTKAGLSAGSRAKGLWVKRNPKKKKASNAIARAIREGKLTTKPCEVCGCMKRPHAHHDDYDKIYDIRWLCPKHHRDWHKQNGEAKNPI